MNDESIHEEMAALMQHMVRRGVSRKMGAYMMACTIGNVLGAFCEDDDSKALVLAALVRVARIRAGLPELN